MRSFYHYMMTHRGRKKPTDESRLADWMFGEHNFPKHSSSYDEISEYLEWNSPFHGSLQVFDRLWSTYESSE